MRVRRQSGGPRPQDYRLAAAGVLALALVAGLLADGDDRVEPKRVATAPLHSSAPSHPANAFALDPEDRVESEPQPEARPALPSQPPMPGMATARPAPSATAAPALPNPAQIDQLIAASRARSGGVEQGDEARPG